MAEIIAAPRRGRHRTRSRPGASRRASTLVSDLFATLFALRAVLERIYAPAGLTEHKFAVLSTLAARSPAPSLATELAHAARVTRASMTSLLDDLEHRGWIERRRGVQDRRVIHVHLTDAGREVVNAAGAHFERLCQDLLGEVRPRELSRFIDLCAALRRASHSLSAHGPVFQLHARS